MFRHWPKSISHYYLLDPLGAGRRVIGLLDRVRLMSIADEYTGRHTFVYVHICVCISPGSVLKSNSPSPIVPLSDCLKPGGPNFVSTYTCQISLSPVRLAKKYLYIVICAVRVAVVI